MARPTQARVSRVVAAMRPNRGRERIGFHLDSEFRTGRSAYRGSSASVALHELAPALVLGRAPALVPLRLHPAVGGQHLGQVRERADHARRPPRPSAAAPSTVASAPAASTGAPIDVGLQLEQQRLVGEPAVDPQGLDRGGLADRRDHVRHPPGDSLERRPGDVLPRRPAVDPRDHRARVGPPPGRPDPRQPGQHPGPGGGLRLAGQLAERGRVLGDPELVAHPLQHRPGGEDAAVERVLDLAVDAPGDGRQQPPGRLRDPLADVGEDEDAGPVGRLDPAGLDAGRARQRRLLVDDLAPEGQLDRPALVLQRAELARRVADLRQHVHRHAEDLAEALVEAPGLSIRCSWVREAVAGSVAKPAPSRSQRNESTVPIRSLPSSRAFLTSSLWRSSQASLAAEK